MSQLIAVVTIWGLLIVAMAIIGIFHLEEVANRIIAAIREQERK